MDVLNGLIHSHLNHLFHFFAQWICGIEIIWIFLSLLQPSEWDNIVEKFKANLKLQATSCIFIPGRKDLRASQIL